MVTCCAVLCVPGNVLAIHLFPLIHGLQPRPSNLTNPSIPGGVDIAASGRRVSPSINAHLLRTGWLRCR